MPLLVIFGAEDQIYDAQAAIARYRQNVPGAQTHLIPGAGHSPERREAEPGGAADPGVRDAAAAGARTAEEAKGRCADREGPPQPVKK